MSGLLDQRAFHGPVQSRLGILGAHLGILAWIGWFGESAGLFDPNPVPILLGAPAVGLCLYSTVRQAWWVLRPPVLARVDGHGIHIPKPEHAFAWLRGWRRPRGAARWRTGPWGEYRQMARESKGRHPALVARFAPESAASGHPDLLFVFPQKALRQGTDELEDAIRHQGDYAAPGEAAGEPPKRVTPAAEAPPSLVARKRHWNPEAPLVQTPGYLGFLWLYLLSHFLMLGAAVASIIIGSVFVTLLVMFRMTREQRRSTRTVIDQAGVSTYGNQRHWALAWDQVLGVHELLNCQGQSFVALLHAVDPPPPATGHRNEHGTSRKVIPSFRFIATALPEGQCATGWCLIETSGLDAEHEAVLAACRQGVAWGHGLAGRKTGDAG